LKSIKLFRIAGVNGWHWQSALLQVLTSFLAQVLLKKCSIASIGFEGRVGNVSSKGHNSNDKVYDDVEHHPGLDRGWQPTINLHAAPHNQKGKQHIQNVTNSIKSMLASFDGDPSWVWRSNLRRDQSQNATPAKSDAAATEQSQVETVSSALDFGQDFAIIFGNARRESLLSLFNFASRRPI
jgi:hypothetical protein